MIKINLLPRTINEKAVIRNTALVFVALLVAIAVGGFTYASNLGKQVAQKEADAQAAEAWQARVEGIQKQAQEQTASIQPIKSKLDFINSVLKFNEEYPKLYAQVAKWTYDKVMYTALACDGTQVVLTARTKNLDYLGRYLLNMYRATDLFTEVTISGVPGYRQNGQAGAMGGTLPGMDATAAARAAFTAPAFTPQSSSGGPQSSLAGIGAIASSMERVAFGEKWVDFTVVCKLKTPIAAPSFGAGGAPAGGAAGAPGSAPGMPVGG
ncbi:MAG: hypothetical protein ABFD49_07920 [Armatimonadota bacterium]|nr:hypothetical protein [bacterium]